MSRPRKIVCALFVLLSHRCRVLLMKQMRQVQLRVYTDGSCVDDRASGIGIFFGKDHPLNISKAIEGREHNSCLAEIIAAQTALKTLRNWKLYRSYPLRVTIDGPSGCWEGAISNTKCNSNEAVILRTDFLPLVSAMKSSGYCGRFHDDYAILKEEAKRFPKGVEFEHVFGHEGEPGNEAIKFKFCSLLAASRTSLLLVANYLASSVAEGAVLGHAGVPPEVEWLLTLVHERLHRARRVHPDFIENAQLNNAGVVLVQGMLVLDHDSDPETITTTPTERAGPNVTTAVVVPSFQEHVLKKKGKTN
uniref:RNase H type-1 domain-containing protein n=1 Tax=Ascaris lumbricoides TaxID=6252 RepID=A0A9J2PZT4_ASCLU